jgi:conjugative relaxase-like TrwC/TraI family protein
VISIGKLRNAEAAVSYLQHAITDSALDYYAQRGEPVGRWSGTGAHCLGVSGTVTPEQLQALLNGRHPLTGQRLGRTWWSSTNVAFDVTFSAPKSVSLLYAVGDEATRRAVLEAHEAGVDAALQYLQAHAGWARQRNVVTGVVEPVRAELVMPRFLHRTARPVTDPRTGETVIDPQLHTHVPVPTWVCRPDGSWSALLSEPLYRHAAAAGAVGQAAMRKALIDRLGVEVEVMPNGTFEIAGIEEVQRREFSRRRQQIAMAEMVYGIGSREGRQTATLATREQKGEVGVSADLFAQWRARAEAAGLTGEAVRSLLVRRPPAAPFQPTLEILAAQLGADGLTAQAATFSRRDVVRRLCALAGDGATPAQLEAWADAVVTNGALVQELGSKTEDRRPRETPDMEPRLSTPEMIAIERRMLSTAAARRGQASGAVEEKTLRAVLQERPTLSAEQVALVEAVCRGPDGVLCVEGVAGAGKTFALDACREALEASGHHVVGLALAGRAAQTLAEEAGIPAHTIASALPGLAEERLRPGSVVIVDEAGLIGSRQLAELVEVTARDGARLVLCGDPRQLQPIEAGAGFRALCEELGSVQLTESRRQSEIWEREALMMLREGDVSGAADAYREHERVEVAATAMERRRQVVSAALGATAAGQNAIILTRTRDEAAALNDMTRAVRQAAGELGGDELQVGDRAFQVGDVVLCTRNNSRLGVTNGLRGEVVAVDVEDQTMTLQTAMGEVSIDVQRYHHLEHGYALTAHKAQGVTVDVALVVGSEAASREWAYSVMSRARSETRYFTVAEPTRDLEGVRHSADSQRTLAQQLLASWSPSEAKDSTLDYAPARPVAPGEAAVISPVKSPGR